LGRFHGRPLGLSGLRLFAHLLYPLRRLWLLGWGHVLLWWLLGLCLVPDLLCPGRWLRPLGWFHGWPLGLSGLCLFAHLFHPGGWFRLLWRRHGLLRHWGLLRTGVLVP
jgi:hypothetical protein